MFDEYNHLSLWNSIVYMQNLHHVKLLIMVKAENKNWEHRCIFGIYIFLGMICIIMILFPDFFKYTRD